MNQIELEEKESKHFREANRGNFEGAVSNPLLPPPPPPPPSSHDTVLSIVESRSLNQERTTSPLVLQVAGNAHMLHISTAAHHHSLCLPYLAPVQGCSARWFKHKHETILAEPSAVWIGLPAVGAELGHGLAGASGQFCTLPVWGVPLIFVAVHPFKQPLSAAAVPRIPGCLRFHMKMYVAAEEKAADLKLLEAPPDGAGAGGKTKTLVPRAQDADDEEEDEGEQSSSDDEEVSAPPPPPLPPQSDLFLRARVLPVGSLPLILTPGSRALGKLGAASP